MNFTGLKLLGDSMFRTSLLAVALVCGISTTALAVPTITAGHHLLLPNTANQKIAIMISDDGQGQNVPPNPPGQIAGVDLVLLVGDGTYGPIITAIDLVGPGTIFNVSNTGQQNFPGEFGPPSRETLSFTSSVSPASVNANGVLAFVTLTTVGMFSLPLNIPFSLVSDNLGPSDVGNLDFLPILVNGSFNSPEPAAIVMGLMGAAALGAVMIRKRRARG